MKNVTKKWPNLSAKISFVTNAVLNNGERAKIVDTFVERPVKSILLDIIIWDEDRSIHMAYIKPSWGLGVMIFDSQGLKLAFQHYDRTDKVVIDIINNDFRNFFIETRVHIDFEASCVCAMDTLMARGCQCGGE